MNVEVDKLTKNGTISRRIDEKLAKKFPFKEREYGGAWDTVRRADGSMVKP